ncbi:hypothetical protein CIW48_08990 [Methylobacterium sp. P1-11]|uniref:hypothetical protein n=1 Tax=Methylobacterium sp. P1-11 TaxID=2024616 RepID=UPI0011EBE6AC|nr:hypothetical protein [Methylobacterium sp. P1-11]KAA0124025.1 hypothetical protein CIW48_08990 [Methylobacterium sp. P1-11]
MRKFAPGDYAHDLVRTRPDGSTEQVWAGTMTIIAGRHPLSADIVVSSDPDVIVALDPTQAVSVLSSDGATVVTAPEQGLPGTTTLAGLTDTTEAFWALNGADPIKQREAMGAFGASDPSSPDDAEAGSATTGLMTSDLTRRRLLALAGSVPLAIGVSSSLPAPALAKIARGQLPVFDMFDGAVRDGATANEPLLNQMLSDYNGVEALPVGQGRGPILAKNGPIIVPPNAKFRGTAGRQGTVITRLPGYMGDTLQMGSPTAGMGSAEIEGLWFVMPGRFLGQVPAGTTPQGLVPNTSTLTGGSTASAAHVRAYGSQFGAIRNCGAQGMPTFFIAQEGGYALTLENPASIGGLWDRTNPALQESVAVLAALYNPVHGHPACTTVINPNFVGGNISAETRTITLYNKTYTCQERLGPKWGLWHAAGEDIQVLGGFMGGFNRTPIAIFPGGPAIINGKPAWVQIKLSLLGCHIDESMWAGIEARRTDASQAILNVLSILGCEFNGQLVGAHGIDIAPSSLMAVARLRAANNILAAYQGAAARFYAVDGGSLENTAAWGFNVAGFDTTKGDPLDYGAGVLLGGLTRNFDVSNLRGGGGPNGDTDPNNCQWLLGDTTPVQNGASTQSNSYFRVRTPNLGLAGGAVVAGGVNDKGG